LIGHPSRLVPAQQIGRRPPLWFIVEIEIAKRHSALIADDEACVVMVFDGPGWREAAVWH